jgi:hypothetical protein
MSDRSGAESIPSPATKRRGPQRKNLVWLRAMLEPGAPLRSGARLVGAVLSQLCDYDTLAVRQTQAAMASHSSLSLATVKRALTELQTQGYLEKRHQGGSGWATLYVGVIPAEPPTEPVPQASDAEPYPVEGTAEERAAWRARHQ